MMPAVSPFPYRRWPRVSRAQARLLRNLLHAFGGAAQRRAQAQAEALLGTSLRIAAGTPALLDAGEARVALAAPEVVFWLECRADARALPIAIGLAPELGARLCDRMLGGDASTAHLPGEAIDDLSLGVLAYLAARVAAAAGCGLQVRGVLSGGERAAALFGDGRVLSWPLSLALDGRACGGMRVVAAEQGAALLAAAAADTATEVQRPALAEALRGVAVTLCAHAARVTLRQSELAALSNGDVVIPERCRLARDGSAFAGQVYLHAVGSGRGGFVCSARGGELVIEELDIAGETAMSEGKRIETQALELGGGHGALRAAADAPIELCLELARFTMPLGELTELRPGEVLSTGRAIGELVTLSAGGRAFARGELCEVDGEIGVRVTGLLG